jgi:hypothetical protein
MKGSLSLFFLLISCTAFAAAFVAHPHVGWMRLATGQPGLLSSSDSTVEKPTGPSGSDSSSNNNGPSRRPERPDRPARPDRPPRRDHRDPRGDRGGQGGERGRRPYNGRPGGGQGGPRQGQGQFNRQGT